MSSDDPWRHLLTSVRARRSRDAPFFKPACLVAVIDLIEEGQVDPTAMDADLIAQRVDQIVRVVHLGRADMRWRTVWHLSNDGAWDFAKGGRRIGPEDFEPARKPDSLREWRDSFDHLAVPQEMLVHWQSPRNRAMLRHAAIAMLEEGDVACRSLALDLRRVDLQPATLTARGASGQGFSSDPVARRAIETHAMAVARDWLENDGWAVEDRSGSESYDFLATRRDQTLYVEVKGTTGRGDTIQLTRLEVEFALANKDQMALAVVADVTLVRDQGSVTAADGALTVRRPWAPAMSSLRPIAYTCSLEAQP